MSDNEMFKTTLMGGYDKDDVMEQIRKLKDAHAGEVGRLTKEIQQKNSRIEELTHRLVAKEEQKENLEQEIKNKYQKYIDHYDSISRLVVESQIRAENIINEARAKGERMIAQAEEEAQKKIDSVQAEVDRRVDDGKRKCEIVQKRLDEIVDLMNQVQKRFMASYKEIHQMIDNSPAPGEIKADDLIPKDIPKKPEEKMTDEDLMVRNAEKTLREIERKIRKDLELEEVLDEEDDLTEEDIELFLQKHGIGKKK
ncbi:MAG: hypothetical protein ACOX8H_04535 [Ruminococcus sp.]